MELVTLEDYATEDSDQDREEEVFTPSTPLTPASPKKRSKCREKHIPCPYEGCDKLFNRPSLLEQHKRSHTNERIYKCPDPNCTKDFLRKTHLDRHFEVNHMTGQKAWVCQYEGCDQSFVTKQRLRRHQLAHEKRDMYRCTEPGCDLTFRKHNTLNRHVRTEHQGQAAYPCDEILEDGSVCPEGFDRTYYLKLHKARDHGIGTISCTICPPSSENAFATLQDLQIHTKIFHPPACEICGHIAKSPKGLATHIRQKHNNDTLESRKKFFCSIEGCQSKGFVGKKNLKLHVRTVHEGQRLYQCGDASLSLNHVEGWDFESACGQAFSSKASLEKHIGREHMDLKKSPRPSKKRKQQSNPQLIPLPKKRVLPSKLDHLTGQSMVDPRRTIPCPCQGCKFMFIREWDKVVHLKSYHGILEDDDWLITSGMNEDDDDREDGDEFGVVTRLTDTRRVDDVPVYYGSAEERLEALANEGGQFWVGGVDEDEDLNFDPYEYDAFEIDEEDDRNDLLEE